MNSHAIQPSSTLHAVVAADLWARQAAADCVRNG
jgi:hypothetical protein